MKKFFAMIKYLFFPFFSTAASHVEFTQILNAPQVMEIKVETNNIHSAKAVTDGHVINICQYQMAMQKSAK